MTHYIESRQLFPRHEELNLLAKKWEKTEYGLEEHWSVVQRFSVDEESRQVDTGELLHWISLKRQETAMLLNVGFEPYVTMDYGRIIWTKEV